MSTSDFSFSQVTKVEEREPRKSFSKPKPDFWGRGRRPRLRNEQAEAEKCFRSSLFSTEVTWEELKSDVDQISSEESSQHNYQNRMLFSFVWLFRRISQHGIRKGQILYICIKFVLVWRKNFIHMYKICPQTRTILYIGNYYERKRS